MNANELKLEYPWQDSLPEAGKTIAVADGVRWLRMPLPFALDHINLWLLRDEIDGRQGWTVVDTGVARPEVKELWNQIFERELEGLPVLRVLVTHMHPDHVGLADWICKRWQAPLWMSMTDYVLARLWSEPSTDESGQGANGLAAEAHFVRHGLQDETARQQIRARGNYFPTLVPSVPTRFRRLMHGDRIDIGGRDWQIIVGYGHAPEHLSLYSESLRVLISGDMLLPRISTNISVFEHEPEANPLPLYLNSLREYDPLETDTLVLPSHGKPFKGMHERVRQQWEHHAERLEEVLAACHQPQTAADILPVLFRRQLDTHQLTFAMGEALAHLHALYFDGKLKRLLGEDGVYRFVQA
ncbi:MBL fold metallo-hydrolase [Alcaligenes endophyticus]|uniref:MBL fold metallo-hydrolase n=1 Tax=Alcaligenes endophyticus TaxID=1929088 RepID=A0ABT8EFB0_9BURK|nr:MBL fold metallo-hydrolase [Alcaligenes endophyticus]MCX5590439.1 MBL fold metallo-hydrolase [Alcaligenes endophyticus]MDN4119897.1 MBL fold metallo-hydrolase [Alcaligenes endophyticus]